MHPGRCNNIEGDIPNAYAYLCGRRFCGAPAGFAFSARAEELHKDGPSTSGVRLTYETTALPDGRLQVDLILECREKGLKTTHGAAVVAVVSKARSTPDIQKSSLTCESTGDRITVIKKATGKVTLSGVTAADIGTKVFVVGRAKADESPLRDKAMQKLEDAVQKEVDKAIAG
jgi:hypothetical protein